MTDGVHGGALLFRLLKPTSTDAEERKYFNHFRTGARALLASAVKPSLFSLFGQPHAHKHTRTRTRTRRLYLFFTL